MFTTRARPGLGLLILRVATGFVFFMHGYQKVFSYGMSGITAGFEKSGIPMPGLMGPGISLLELVGGVLLILGLLTLPMAALFVCDMIGAIMFVHLKGGFFAPAGFEFPLMLLITSLTLAIAGPGDASIDAMLMKPKSAT